MFNTIGVRTNVYNETFLSESDQDANSALTELDKGLRSSRLGEQCEAIVRFPKLFEKYPFPILINSSFLKLAEFFRTGSNLLRLWVMRVCQQSEKHLDKILSVDEFVKRLFMVTHSNDPIARALTLRTLGAVAGVIPEKQQVHHAIRRALDSHDTVEVEAAIYASVQFAAQSKTFAISMCSKIASMIESLQTPVDMKLQLIPILRHMHHDANTAALVRTLCLNLLPKYPSASFIVVILDSLTELSCDTLIDIPDQVNIVLNYLQDPRKRVRYQVLKSLLTLAKKGSSLWPKGALRILITKAMNRNELCDEQSMVLSVILALTNCPITCNSFLNEDQNLLLELCSSCLTLEHHKASNTTMKILTALIVFSYKEIKVAPINYINLINMHLESLIYASLGDENSILELSGYLKCGVLISEQNIQFALTFLDLIAGLLTSDIDYPCKQSILICEALGALGSEFAKRQSPAATKDNIEPNENYFKKHLSTLFKKLEFLVEGNISEGQIHLIEVLSAVCLQSMMGSFIPQNVLALFDKVTNRVHEWAQYRIARSASRFGHHLMATKIYLKLSSMSHIEKLNFFFLSLAQISQAECILNYGQSYEMVIANQNGNLKETDTPLTDILESAITLYWKALATLKSSSLPTQSSPFQIEFIRLRAQFLEALHYVVVAKNTQAITPSPAIAQSIVQYSRDPLQKYGHITNQLRKAVKTIRACEENYLNLYRSSFDADPATLEYLEINQVLCNVLSTTIESICFTSNAESATIPGECKFIETKNNLRNCHQVYNESLKLPQETGNQKTITSLHTDVIIDQICLIIRSPTCIPRLYFQVLQNTSIKINFSPQPRIAGEPVTVQPGSNLVVKVEGVIQHYGKIPSLYRSVDTIQLTLTSQLISPKSIDFKSTNDTITLTQKVKPHRDFLSGNFLLSLNNIQNTQYGPISAGGQWQVTLEASIIDKNGVLWSSGLKTSRIIRVPDDPCKPQMPVSGKWKP